MNSSQSDNQINNYSPESGNNKKLIITVIVIIVLVIILVISGYFAYKLFLNKDISNLLPLLETNTEETKESPDSQDQSQKTTKESKQDDGNTNVKNVLKSDSDGDGLTDKQENITWKTDPNNPDSDGDGYLDGEETKGGFNPSGEGNMPTAEEIIEKLKTEGLK